MKEKWDSSSKIRTISGRCSLCLSTKSSRRASSHRCRMEMPGANTGRWAWICKSTRPSTPTSECQPSFRTSNRQVTNRRKKLSNRSTSRWRPTRANSWRQSPTGSALRTHNWPISSTNRMSKEWILRSTSSVTRTYPIWASLINSSRTSSLLAATLTGSIHQLWRSPNTFLVTLILFPRVQCKLNPNLTKRVWVRSRSMWNSRLMHLLSCLQRTSMKIRRMEAFRARCSGASTSLWANSIQNWDHTSLPLTSTYVASSMIGGRLSFCVSFTLSRKWPLMANPSIWHIWWWRRRWMKSKFS